MWPMVPVVHMIYRLWQLGRGSALVAVYQGPPHIQYILVCNKLGDLLLHHTRDVWLILVPCTCVQAVLAIVWTVNTGAVACWMPWLFYWQLQPARKEASE